MKGGKKGDKAGGVGSGRGVEVEVEERADGRIKEWERGLDERGYKS